MHRGCKRIEMFLEVFLNLFLGLLGGILWSHEVGRSMLTLSWKYPQVFAEYILSTYLSCYQTSLLPSLSLSMCTLCPSCTYQGPEHLKNPHSYRECSVEMQQSQRKPACFLWHHIFQVLSPVIKYDTINDRTTEGKKRPIKEKPSIPAPL